MVDTWTKSPAKLAYVEPKAERGEKRQTCENSTSGTAFVYFFYVLFAFCHANNIFQTKEYQR